MAGETDSVMPKQTILLEGRVWEIERERSWSPFQPDSYSFAHSHALICPVRNCLKQWAVMAFEGDETIAPTPQRCRTHGGGSLFVNYGSLDEPLLNALPEELLKRELEVNLDLMEKRDGIPTR